MVSGVCKVFAERFRAFQRFSEFGMFFESPQSTSQNAILFSELRVVLPLIVLPLKINTRQSADIQSESFARYGKSNIYHVQVIFPDNHATV